MTSLVDTTSSAIEDFCCVVTSWIVASFLAAGSSFTLALGLEVFFNLVQVYFLEVVDLALIMPYTWFSTLAAIAAASFLSFFFMTNEFNWEEC